MSKENGLSREALVANTNYGSQNAVAQLFDEVRLNGRGDKEDGGGTFSITRLSGEKDKDGKYVSELLDAPIGLVILDVRKVRREWDEKTEKFVRYCSEYRDKDETVIVFDKEQNTERTILAEDIYGEYPNMSTTTRLYSVLLVKEGKKTVEYPIVFSVKGASSFSKSAKKGEPMRWTEYYSTFKDGELPCDFVTEVTAIKEKNDKGVSFHRCVFSRGDAYEITKGLMDASQEFKTRSDIMEKQTQEKIAKIGNRTVKVASPVAVEPVEDTLTDKDIPF